MSFWDAASFDKVSLQSFLQALECRASLMLILSLSQALAHCLLPPLASLLTALTPATCKYALSNAAGLPQTQAGVRGWETAAEDDIESSSQGAECRVQSFERKAQNGEMTKQIRTGLTCACAAFSCSAACLFCCKSASAFRSISFIAGLICTPLASNSLHADAHTSQAGMYASM